MGNAKNWIFPAISALSAVAAVAFHTQDNALYRLIFALAAVLAIAAWAVVWSPRLGTTVTALQCAFFNGYLLFDKLDPSHGPALCSVNEVVNCSAVNASTYSEIFGLPVTLLGVAFYVGLGIASLLSKEQTPRFHQVNGLFAMFSLAFSLYLANATIALGLVCPFCISIYVGNGLLFWSAMRGLEETEGNLFADVPGALQSPSTVLITLIFAVTVGGYSFLSMGAQVAETVVTAGMDPEERKEREADRIAELYAKVGGELTLDGTEPSLGSNNPTYDVVEFADYGCPHCAHAAKDIKRVIDQMPDVRLRFKVFPLTGACNPGLPDRGEDRCLAAAATDCALEQEKFWEYQNLVFVNQQYLDIDSLRKMAEQVNLDIPTWEQCVQSDTVMPGVLADAQAGQDVGVMGTPSFYLKGTHGDDWILINGAVDSLVKVIEAHQAGIPMREPASPPVH